MSEHQYERIIPSRRFSTIPDAEGVVAFIKRFSIWGLGGSDGCDCCYFELLGYHVHLSCRKSEHCIRVFSTYLGHSYHQAFPIALAVLEQLDNPNGYRVRFCDYGHDHKNGHWQDRQWMKDQACCYCDQLGRDEDAYLCDKCLAKPDLRRRFDASEFEALRPQYVEAN